MYLRPADEDQPVRLVGWQAVTVASGESATVTVTPDDRMWRRWNPAGAGRAARGLGDIRATLPL